MYTVKPDEELLSEEEKRAEASDVFKPAADISLSAGGGGAKDPKPEGSGSFTNLRGFIDANKGKNSTFAQGIATDLSSQQDAALKKAQDEANTFTASSEGMALSDPTSLIEKAKTNAASLTDAEKKQLSSIWQGGYTGGLNFTSDEAHGQIAAIADKTQNAVKDQGAVLNDWYAKRGAGNITQGEKAFDQMMLGQDADAQSKLKTVADNAGKLESQFTDIVTKANAADDAVGAKNKKTSTDTKTALQGIYDSIIGNVNKSIETANSEDATKYSDAVSTLTGEGGSVDPLQANTAFNVMDAQTQANILALADILGIESDYRGNLVGRQQPVIHQGTVPGVEEDTSTGVTSDSTQNDKDPSINNVLPGNTGLTDEEQERAKTETEKAILKANEYMPILFPSSIGDAGKIVNLPGMLTQDSSDIGTGIVNKIVAGAPKTTANTTLDQANKTQDFVNTTAVGITKGDKGGGGNSATANVALAQKVQDSVDPGLLMSKDTSSKSAVLSGLFPDLGGGNTLTKAYVALQQRAAKGGAAANKLLNEVNMLYHPNLSGSDLLKSFSNDPAAMKDWRATLGLMLAGYQGTAISNR
jgi:hypothetical protein